LGYLTFSILNTTRSFLYIVFFFSQLMILYIYKPFKFRNLLLSIVPAILMKSIKAQPAFHFQLKQKLHLFFYYRSDVETHTEKEKELFWTISIMVNHCVPGLKAKCQFKIQFLPLCFEFMESGQTGIPFEAVSLLSCRIGYRIKIILSAQNNHRDPVSHTLRENQSFLCVRSIFVSSVFPDFKSIIRFFI